VGDQRFTVTDSQAFAMEASACRVLIGYDAMTDHLATSTKQAITIPADITVPADLDAAAQTAALWCKRSSPDPRSTISAMWASSLVWAAENLADMLSTTVKNVKCSR